jgi:hypothetical protein
MSRLQPVDAAHPFAWLYVCVDGGLPAGKVLTCPADWGQPRRNAPESWVPAPARTGLAPLCGG